MKAKIKPRIQIENRTKLEEVIPLETPFIIFVDPSDACNFRCKFCPTGDTKLLKSINRTPKIMDFDLYKKILRDLGEFAGPIKVLRLYKDGEPLLNPHFADMVKLAKESGCILEVDTTTNGSLLTPEKNLEIVEAGLDRIYISINGLSDKSYLEFTRKKIDFSKLVGNIKHLYENRKQCVVCVKIVGDNLSEKEQELFFDTFGNICDEISIEHIAPCWPEFEMKEATPNQSVGIYGQEINEVTVCPYIFYSISINSNGEVSLCFLDWARKLIIGDVNKNTIKQIWNNHIINEFRIMNLLEKRKEHQICGSCNQLRYCWPDNIDPFAKTLLKKIQKSD